MFNSSNDQITQNSQNPFIEALKFSIQMISTATVVVAIITATNRWNKTKVTMTMVATTKQ